MHFGLSYRTTYTNNTCNSNNESGIRTFNIINSHFEKNTCNDNKEHGMYLNADVISSTFMDNTCSYNTLDGINITTSGSWRTRDSTFDHNNLSNNKNGMLMTSFGVDIENNIFFDNIISFNTNHLYRDQ